jgi:hypothetical protein
VVEKLERLTAAGIRLLPTCEITTHYVFERDGFVALVARAGDGFGEIGSPGILTPQGFAALIRRKGKAFFVAQGYEQPADERQVEKLRQFASDLQAVLR